jgi:hypothetical protein
LSEPHQLSMTCGQSQVTPTQEGSANFKEHISEIIVAIVHNPSLLCYILVTYILKKMKVFCKPNP